MAAIVQIRIKQTEEDVPLILTFIRELAEYEQLVDHVSATEDKLRATSYTNVHFQWWCPKARVLP